MVTNARWQFSPAFPAKHLPANLLKRPPDNEKIDVKNKLFLASTFWGVGRPFSSGLGVFCTPFGHPWALSGSSWGDPGRSWDPRGALLERSWALLGALGRSWSALWVLLGAVGWIFDGFWKGFWVVFG